MSQRVTQDVEQPISGQIVEAVAEAKDVSSMDLKPLYETVDPDAIDALFRTGTAGRVEFVYEGCEVLVHADGDVDVLAPGA